MLSAITDIEGLRAVGVEEGFSSALSSNLNDRLRNGSNSFTKTTTQGTLTGVLDDESGIVTLTLVTSSGRTSTASFEPVGSEGYRFVPDSLLEGWKGSEPRRITLAQNQEQIAIQLFLPSLTSAALEPSAPPPPIRDGGNDD